MTFNRLLAVTLLLATALIATTFSEQAEAQSRKKRGGRGAFAGGSLSIGGGIGLVTASQTGLNTMINAAKTTNTSTAGEFSSGLEFIGYGTFRFSNNWIALQLRPSYFTQSTGGNGNDGTYNYELTGYTLFPLVRFIPLSNDFIDFYMQGGIGWGKLSGDIRNGARTASFSGSAFGMQIGLGAEFCFTSTHCMNIEGNYRYLPIERNIVNSASGGLLSGASQTQSDRELEDLNGSDVATSMTGIGGILSYTLNF